MDRDEFDRYLWIGYALSVADDYFETPEIEKALKGDSTPFDASDVEDMDIEKMLREFERAGIIYWNGNQEQWWYRQDQR